MRIAPVAILLLVSCSLASAQSTAPASSPAALPAAGEVMATVNGQPIYMNELNDILLYSYGITVAHQLVANELVEQECRQQKVSVTPQEVQQQHLSSLEQMFPEVESTQRQRAFEEYLIGKGVTQKQWDFTMRRLAQLAKLAEPRVNITDEDLQSYFGEMYGRRVVTRHIQMASLAEAQDVLAQLEKGGDFIALAQSKSISPTRANGGLLSPISATSREFPPAIKEAALALNKVGQLSTVIQAGTAFHLLKLEQIIPPQNVKFEDVKAKLQSQLHQSRIQMLQQRILLDLIREAQDKGSIQFINPVLKETHKINTSRDQQE